MTNSEEFRESSHEGDDSDVTAVYGTGQIGVSVEETLDGSRKDFEPWHHPVKQIVRKHQWASLCQRLLRERASTAEKVLHYFTLPGGDLLDVRVLAEICEPMNVQIQYFGFNSNNTSVVDDGYDAHVLAEEEGSWIAAESALRQSGHITSDAIVLSDRLEDIALQNSQAAQQLKQRAPFDVINIDACDHLSYCAAGRTNSIFDALKVLLKHQMRATTPWLLFITTRAQPDLMGRPGLEFQTAISQNLQVENSPFEQSLADCLEIDVARFASQLNAAWNIQDISFLKLYTVGLGKYLLQFFHAQPNLPAKVELASVYTYRVYGDNPDMLALAFRITPSEPVFYPPGLGGAVVVPSLEPELASKVAKNAAKIQDLDVEMIKDHGLRIEAVNGTFKLLTGARYDTGEWQQWLADHKKRPMDIALDIQN